MPAGSFMSQVYVLQRALPDQKESFQITLPHMDDLCPNQTVVPDSPGCAGFWELPRWQWHAACCPCFRERLALERDFVPQAHMIAASRIIQSTLRLLHYALPARGMPRMKSLWRGRVPHTDFDCDHVFQQEGQGGLRSARQGCRGRG